MAGLTAVAVLIVTCATSGFAQEKSAEQVQDTDKLSVEDLLEEAQQAMRQEDYKEAAELFQKVVDQDADNGIAWQQLGYCLHSSGDLDAAIPVHKKAATFAPFKSVSLYNLGCAYALKNDPDKAFDYLNQAAAAGFDQVGQAEGDSDLDSLRDDPRFSRFMAAMKGGPKPTAKGEQKKSDVSLVGTWKVESGSRMGNKSAEDQLPPAITIDDKVIRIPTPDGQEFVMSYKVDDSKKPIQIDMKIEEGPAPESKALGIIKLDGDKFTLCYDPTGESRPDEFASTEDDGFHLFVMKKTPAKFDAAKLVGNWTCISGSRAGEAIAKENLAGQKVEITKDEIILEAGPDMKFVMSYEIDATKTPVAVNMKIKEGPAPEGSEAVGIIKMEGDKCSLCYDAMNGKRPEKFETTAENGYFLFNLKKVVVD
jgi:uncharacterized protein (TIGR03067 family)